MKAIRRTTRMHRSRLDDLWPTIARVALILLMLLIVLTPVTQSIWSGDNILQRGGDTEHTLIIGLTLISLSLLLCRNRQSALLLLLDRLQEFFSGFLSDAQTRLVPQQAPVLRPHFERLKADPDQGGSFNLPLLI